MSIRTVAIGLNHNNQIEALDIEAGELIDNLALISPTATIYVHNPEATFTAALNQTGWSPSIFSRIHQVSQAGPLSGYMATIPPHLQHTYKEWVLE